MNGLTWDPTPDMVIHNQEGSKKIRNSPSKSDGIVPQIRHPNSWIQHWEDKLPKCLVLKINGD